MKKKLKTAEEKSAKANNKGITLIALVVTIVVLLILAAITITAVMSEGGIFNTAQRSKKIQDESAIREKVQIMLADAQLGKLLNDKSLKTYFEEQGYTVTEDATAGTLTIPVDGYDVTIEKDTLEITKMEESTGSGSGTGGNGEAGTTVAVTGVSLDKETETMTVGGTLTLTATIEPTGATNKQLNWVSSVPSVATVSNGTITAKAAGTTKITVTTVDGSFSAECNITVNEAGSSSVADLIGQAAKSTNTYTEDKYGNSIVIPAGFTVLGNGGETYVVYDYDKNEQGISTGIPVVQDGIVIQDGEGNEFVWVPVGDIYNDTTGTNITPIKLGRYDTNNGFIMDTNTTPPTPPTPIQQASITEYDVENSSYLININNTRFFEKSTGTYNDYTYKTTGNFEGLGTWIANTIYNGGYYIGRYEASYGVDEIANCKQSEGTPAGTSYVDSGTLPTFEEGQLWNYVSQADASEASKAMYPKVDGGEFYSDLINSYAWDTTIIFIQTYSENPTYATQTSVYYNNTSGQPSNTGERGNDATIAPGTTDKVCNIYDMASNMREWTTETAVYSDYPCVNRGGFYGNAYAKTCSRGATMEGESHDICFRPIIDCRTEN